MLLVSLFKAQSNTTDYLSIPGPLDFNGTEYFLVWSKQVSPTLLVQQYLPKDEELENFSQLITISYFNKDINVEQAIRQKVEIVQELGEKDKLAKIDISENPDGTEYIVDYSLSGKNKSESPYLEYSVDRFKKFQNGKKPMLIFSYKKRMYGDDLKGASKAISKQRNQLITSTIEYAVPIIQLKSAE